MPKYNQPSSNKSSSNKLPPSPFKECTNYDECTKVAVDRLKDAVALLKDGQYIGALYMAGYVIEIGTKAEFHKLAKKEVPSKFKNNDDGYNKILEILKYVAGKKIVVPKSSLEDCFKSAPPTVLQLLNCLRRDYLSPPTQAFSCIVDNRYKPDIVENRYKPEQERGTFHNIESFLEELQKWKKKLDDKPPFESRDYNISSWGTNLRYSIIDEASTTATVKAVKKGVKTSFYFLEKVLKIEDKLSFIRRELIEIGVLGPDQTLGEPINEDVHKSKSEYIMSNEVKNEVNKNV